MNRVSALIIISLLAVCAFAKAPQYRSLRIHGMGNAFVGVADNKDALYYNPAGLNLINRLGNFEKNPDMGYMPRNRWSLNLVSVAVEYPGTEMNDIMDACGTKGFGASIRGIFLFDFGRFGDVKWCPELIDRLEGNNGYDKMKVADMPDSLDKHQDYLKKKLTRFDRRPVKVGVQASVLELAVHNFGLAVWSNTSVSPYLDLGIIVPSAGYLPVTVDVVAQTAFAFSPVDRWSVGVGIKAVKRAFMPGFEFYPLSYEEDLDTLEQRGEDFVDVFTDDVAKLNKYTYALDFGVLYQLNREVRLGASLRDFYLSKLAGESITPNLSFGAAATPRILQNNNWFDRKVNFAADYVDVLNDNLLDMPLSHLNFGMEIEQVIIPSPVRNMWLLPRLLFGILGGDPLRASVGGGFEGGYWAATGALKVTFVELRLSSFAEEMGVKTGQSENRHYMLQVSTTF